MSSDYNGWKNYETWNVSLHIKNNQDLYALAKAYKERGYISFVASLAELDPTGGISPIRTKTPDGVAWNDPSLDFEALNSMMEDL